MQKMSIFLQLLRGVHHLGTLVESLYLTFVQHMATYALSVVNKVYSYDSLLHDKCISAFQLPVVSTVCGCWTSLSAGTICVHRSLTT